MPLPRLNQVLAVLAVGSAACATPRADRWEDGAITARASRPATHFPASRQGTSLQDEGRPLRAQSLEEVSVRQTELALLRFGPRRKALARELEAGAEWPPQMQSLWIELLSRFDGLLAGDEPIPVRLLLQARVATEVERDLTERRFGPCPPAVSTRITRVFERIALHLRRLRPPERLASRGAAELVWPVTPVIVTSNFGYRRDPLTDQVKFHSGIDLGGRTGDVVASAGPGRIIHAGWLGGYGKAVIVEHPGGYQTVYGHLRTVLVPLESEVDAGSPVGLLGSSGRSTGPHLHFEVRQAGVAVDPHRAVGMQWVSLVSERE